MPDPHTRCTLKQLCPKMPRSRSKMPRSGSKMAGTTCGNEIARRVQWRLEMKTTMRMLLSTVAAGPLVIALFAGTPAFAQCNDRPAQALAQLNPDLRDP